MALCLKSCSLQNFTPHQLFPRPPRLQNSQTQGLHPIRIQTSLKQYANPKWKNLVLQNASHTRKKHLTQSELQKNEKHDSMNEIVTFLSSFLFFTNKRQITVRCMLFYIWLEARFSPSAIKLSITFFPIKNTLPFCLW